MNKSLLETKNTLKIEWEELEITVKTKNKINCTSLLEKLNKSIDEMVITDANFTSTQDRWCFELTGKDIVVTLDGKSTPEEKQGVLKGE